MVDNKIIKSSDFLSLNCNELQLINGGGWLRSTCSIIGAVAAGIGGGVAGATLGTAVVPGVGTVICAIAGAVTGTASGYVGGNEAGIAAEKFLGM